jgi:ferredoxin-NADP reductase
METPGAASLWLEVPSDLRTAFRYNPGQFVTIEATLAGEALARQYSLSSSPDLDSALRITVKKTPNGRMSAWLVDKVTVGDVLDVTTPRGRFYHAPEAPRHTILLACGSGIAPMVPIARQLLASDPRHKVTLAYGNRTADDIILEAEVRDLSRQYPNCTVEIILSRADPDWSGPTGHIDPSFLARHHIGWAAQAPQLPITVYLCGPEPFMDAAESFYMAQGVALADIRRESFSIALDDDEPPITVRGPVDVGIEGAGERIVAVVGNTEYAADVHADESILAALLRCGADVPHSCQEGTCSSCISKLTEGSVQVHAGVLKTLRQADLEEGLLLACLARPTTKAVRIDFDNI